MRKNRKRLFCGVLLMLVWLSFVVNGSHALLSTNSLLTNNMVKVGQGSLVIINS